ncbi:tetratricopeptide repeat protein [Candidatus Leptofilum sp.]|uniref:tetratricopeptide repeat protein n=1 Tax=Candidatus Leptofilum sp. TaxID=3241576 RepID=UPI003B59EC84
MNDFPELHTLWDYNDPAGTAVQFQALLPKVEASDERGYHVELLSQMARTHSLQKQFDDAHQLLDEAETMLTDDMIVPKMRCLLERGRAFNSAGEAARALPLFHEAFVLGTSFAPQADFHTIDAAHMMAIAEPDTAVQLKWHERALEMAEATPDERAAGWLGSLYNNLGWTYHDMGNFERALAIFEKALAWREANHQDKPGTIRIAKWCVGRALRSLNRLDEALAVQQALLAEFADSERKDGFVFEELAECLLALNREDEARPYFAQAHAELSQLGWLEPERLARLQQLSAG